MKLDDKEFKRFKALTAKEKAGNLSKEEAEELQKLKEKKETKTARGDSFKPGNDFAWWNKIPELIRDSASFKCNWIPGTAIAPGAFTDTGVGVLSIEVDTLMGCSVAPTDPVNVWARDLYLRMFQKYRPASGYTASDLGIALFGAYEAVKLIAFYERIYGVINRYSRLNVNMPIVEAQAMGLTVTDVTYLQGHLSDFRYDLNFLIRKAQRLCIPKDMSIIADAISLFGYEYLDHESVRSQIIMFKPVEYGIYQDVLLSSGGCIQYDSLATNIFDFSADNMCKALTAVLNSLLGSDSIQRIYADLVVWFGSDAMLQFALVPEDYIVVPMKSESILHKVHNLETVEDAVYRLVSWSDAALSSADGGIVSSGHYLYQVDDRIVTAVSKGYLPTGATGGTVAYPIHGFAGNLWATSAVVPAALTLGHVIDTAHNDIQPDIIVEGAMWKEHNVPVSSGGYSAIQIESSTFFCVRRMMLFRSNGSSGFLTTSNTVTNLARGAAALLACVDWAPLSFELNSSNVVVEIYGDYDNIVFVSNPDLSRIQRTIILSGLETAVKVVTK